MGDDSQAVQAARTRARQRLVGALVLLVVGVIAFPLLFETEPRPLAVDTPIKLAQRDSGTVRSQPPAVQNAPDPLPSPAPSAPPALPVDAGLEAPAASAATSAAASVPAAPATARVARPGTSAPPPGAQPEARVEARADPRPEPKAPAQPLPKPVIEPQVSAAPASAATPAAIGRFVVQVGAFGDARTLREARQKVEGLGLKTYTQVITTDAGPRTRVRVGPFESRSEAEAAARTLKGGGLPAAILTL